MYCRWLDIQSLQFHEKHISEIVPQRFLQVFFAKIVEPLTIIISETVCLSQRLFLYTVMILTCCQLAYKMFFQLFFISAINFSRL